MNEDFKNYIYGVVIESGLEQDEMVTLLSQLATADTINIEAVTKSNNYVDSGNNKMALDVLTEAINRIEKLASPYGSDITRKLFGHRLSNLYQMRAGCYLGQSANNNNNNRRDLEKALSDLEIAVSYPDACYELMAVDIRPDAYKTQVWLKYLLNNTEHGTEARNVQSSKNKSSGCFSTISVIALIVFIFSLIG